MRGRCIYGDAVLKVWRIKQTYGWGIAAHWLAGFALLGALVIGFAYVVFQDGQRNLRNYPPGEEPACEHVSNDPNDAMLDYCGEGNPDGGGDQIP